MKIAVYVWVWSVLLLALPPARAGDCEPQFGIESICGLRNPEDIEPVPGSRFLLFGEMVAGGGISSLNIDSDAVRRLYPPLQLDGVGQPGETPRPAVTGRATAAEAPTADWGAANCPGEVGPDLLIHGLHLAQRADGRWQLLAVNHGGRESIEVFEVHIDHSDKAVHRMRGENDVPGSRIAAEGIALDWRGCVPAPDDAYFNDVVALPGGGLLATHMFPRSSQIWGALRSLVGINTGAVYRWQPGFGFRSLDYTRAPFPNGIAIAADGEHFFLNSYSAKQVRKYSLISETLQGVADIENPDNSAWDPRGRLLVTTHVYRWNNLTDGFPEDDGSPMPLHFAVVALDPDSMATERIFQHEGPPMGGATVAVVAGQYMYMGTYAGDRIIKVPLAALQ